MQSTALSEPLIENRPMNTTDDSTGHPKPDTPLATTDDNARLVERRAALAKLGTLAAWTAPTLLTLVVSQRTSAESLPGPPSNTQQGNRNKIR